MCSGVTIGAKKIVENKEDQWSCNDQQQFKPHNQSQCPKDEILVYIIYLNLTIKW